MTTRKALITGAGSGIGLALAKHAVADGFHVIMVGRRTNVLEAAQRELGVDRTTVVTADITTQGGRENVASAVGTELDLLINNAGVIDVGPVGNSDPATSEAVIATNLTAPICLTSAVLPALVRTTGQIANVGSVFGDIGYPYFASYSASKFGLRGYSDALRREVAHSGVTVTYLAPRATSTPAEARFAHLIEPMGMAVDTPERVAGLSWRAISRRKKTAYPPSMERLFVGLQRVAPWVIDIALSKSSRSSEVLESLEINGKEKK